MADVRQQSTIRDDFNRANEDPLSFGGKWSQTDSGIFWPLVVKSNEATHKAFQASSDSYWNSESFDNNEAELWAYATGGQASGVAWALGLFKDVGGSNAIDGYRFRIEVASAGAAYRLYRFANGTGTTIDSPATAAPSGGAYMLMRRNGNDVEGWAAPTGLGTSWSDLALVCSATDTTYTTGLYLTLGIRDNSASQILGFDYFGGGGSVPFRPQFIRRPFG